MAMFIADDVHVPSEPGVQDEEGPRPALLMSGCEGIEVQVCSKPQPPAGSDHVRTT